MAIYHDPDPTTGAPEFAAAIAELTALEPLGPDTWGIAPPPYRQARLFGGHALVFAIAAAGRTIETEQVLHSVRGQFLRAAPAGAQLEVRVERVRDGRNVSVRRATISHGGKAAMAADLTYHSWQEAPDWQVEPPEPAAVRGLPPDAGALRAHPLFAPFEIVPVHPFEFGGRSRVHPYWARPRGELGDDPLAHACALVWLSDLAISVSAHRPAAIWREQHGSVTLDHSMWFHRPPRFSSWLRLEVEPQVNAGGRGLAAGRFVSPEGLVGPRFVQDVLLRPPSG